MLFFVLFATNNNYTGGLWGSQIPIL